ncbi:aspartyl/glutamyl-tRNA amidotransferase subunit C [Mycoplasmopsis phocirhinis]|uniref:Aspartyl/glutamyl-tRNA amidotransferase subunit C n=1 Tax=Mycoplasmopsis phocirhinis TaxID=142650 RepID=A0A4P6MN30_9BACT|nr:Asp-tRNA(Asn)/Glu-tRNA(Gln) amidotransferase subunit GatC [Mycoplasmopsis phocirhinis]QBF34383.1 aspartyl/glutamyl-tRNA amidotransferase subunit C [Mycoplasmopsis phocirhinis]
MKTIDKEKLVNIVKNLLLEPSEDVINQILAEWNLLEHQLKNMQKINTQNVKPLTHINETPLIDFFREDVENTDGFVSKQHILHNAADSDDDYIITSRVVK